MSKRLKFLVVLISFNAASAQTITQPRLISRVEPDLSEEARRAGVNATVGLGLTVSTSGSVEDIKVVRAAGFGLEEQAIKAVSQWRFAPATKDGAAVQVSSTVEVTFITLDANHKGQLARLLFENLADRSPELIKGRIPANPGPNLQSGSLKLSISIASDGRVRDVAPIESDPPEWSIEAMKEIYDWRFSPPTTNGQIVEAQATLEITLARSGAQPKGIPHRVAQPSSPSFLRASKSLATSAARHST